MLRPKRWKRTVDAEMPSLHDNEPIAFPQVLCFPPDNLSVLVDDGQGVVVGCAYPESELRFNRVNLRGPIILGDEGVRVSRSVEHPIAGEVLAQRGTVQKAPERFESLGGPQETVDGDASALFDRLSGRIEDLHERYGTGSDPHCRLHEVHFGTQTREGKASSAPALVDQSLLLQSVEDTDEAIVHREDETG